MAFPTSPQSGQTTTKNGITYSYSSATNSWTRLTTTQGGVFSTLTATKGVFSGDSAQVSLSIASMLEQVTIVNSPSSTYDFDCLTQSICYFTSSSSDYIINFRGSSISTLDSIMSVGQSMSMVLLIANGGTGYYASQIKIDDSIVTPQWQGGTAPTSGNANATDVYSFSIIKTATGTFTALASLTKFA